MSKIADVYHCHWCVSLNSAADLDWCLCATTHRTLVCATCGRCFCTAPEPFRKAFWDLASAALVARRWMAARQTTSKEAAGSDLRRPVILIVDDSKIIHAIIETTLIGFHGTILHAYDGTEGHRIARAVIPEILLIDALLPGIDGREVVRQLKSDPATSGIRTIVMTALYKGSKYRNEAFRDFKVDAYIEKPVAAEQLHAVIDEMLAAVSAPQAVAS